MTSEDNKKIAHRFFDEVWNRGNLDKVNEIVANDIIIHVGGMEFKGSDKYKNFIEGYRNAFPDIKFTVEEQITQGDKVVERWTARGTHQGELQGIPATGKQVVVTGIDIARFEGGKIVERWGQPDLMGMMQQLGVIPEPK